MFFYCHNYKICLWLDHLALSSKCSNLLLANILLDLWLDATHSASAQSWDFNFFPEDRLSLPTVATPFLAFPGHTKNLALLRLYHFLGLVLATFLAESQQILETLTVCVRTLSAQKRVLCLFIYFYFEVKFTIFILIFIIFSFLDVCGVCTHEFRCPERPEALGFLKQES